MSRLCVHGVSMDLPCTKCKGKTAALGRGVEVEALPTPTLHLVVTDAGDTAAGTVSKPELVKPTLAEPRDDFDAADPERPRGRPVPPRCGFHRFSEKNGDEQCLLSQSHPPGHRYLSDHVHNPGAGRGAAGSPPTVPSNDVTTHESPAAGVSLGDGGASQPMTAAEEGVRLQLEQARARIAELEAQTRQTFGDIEVGGLRLEVQRLTEELSRARREHGATLVELDLTAAQRNDAQRQVNELNAEQWRRELIDYIDDAKKALGDQRITGQPLPEAVAMLRASLAKAEQKAEAEAKERHAAVWALAGFVRESCDGHNWRGLIRCAESQRKQLEEKVKRAEHALSVGEAGLSAEIDKLKRELVDAQSLQAVVDFNRNLLCALAFDFARADAAIRPLVAKEWNGNDVVAELDFALPEAE